MHLQSASRHSETAQARPPSLLEEHAQRINDLCKRAVDLADRLEARAIRLREIIEGPRPPSNGKDVSHGMAVMVSGGLASECHRLEGQLARIQLAIEELGVLAN